MTVLGGGGEQCGGEEELVVHGGVRLFSWVSGVGSGDVALEGGARGEQRHRGRDGGDEGGGGQEREGSAALEPVGGSERGAPEPGSGERGGGGVGQVGSDRGVETADGGLDDDRLGEDPDDRCQLGAQERADADAEGGEGGCADRRSADVAEQRAGRKSDVVGVRGGEDEIGSDRGLALDGSVWGAHDFPG